VVAAATAIEVQKKRRKRKMLTKPCTATAMCDCGADNGIIMDLFNTDEISYKNFLRTDAGAVGSYMPLEL